MKTRAEILLKYTPYLGSADITYKNILKAMEEYASQRSLTDEEIENGVTLLATLHAKQSVGDWATGYITGAKWARDRQKGGKP